MKHFPGRRRATIISYAALIIILTAGAAQSLSGSNTVFTDDVVNGQIFAADIATNAVSGSKVYPNSLTGADVRGDTLVYEAEGEVINLNANSAADLDAFCNSEFDIAVSGQWEAWNNNLDVPAELIDVSVSASIGDGWTFHIRNNTAETVEVNTWVMCMQR
ncbi:MAG TPA: hypothetical protein VJ782_01305 [Aeromicrobium sp.]|nr:hypothetical protein [Aeromicrobium sp.]